MPEKVVADSVVALCSIEPDILDAYRPTTVRVHIRPAKPVPAGSVLACQLPNSFLAFRLTQSHTQHLQHTDPTAPHYVSVALADPDLSCAVFSIRIAPCELITGDDPAQQVRHGQRVFAEVLGGDVPAGADIVFTFARMYTPWVANQAEYFYVAINGAAVEPWPSFRVKPNPAVWQRLIAPLSARITRAGPWGGYIDTILCVHR